MAASVASAMALLFGVAVLVAGKGVQTGGAVAQVRPVAVSGAGLGTFTPGAADPAAGRPVPSFAGETFDGAPVEIAPEGRPLVLIFLAHWCPHCQNEVRALGPWLRENGLPEGVDLFSVSTSVDATQPNYPPSDWLAHSGWPVPVLADDAAGSAAAAVGLSRFPFWVFVDARGNVQSRASGEMTIGEFETALRRLQGR